MKYTKERLEEAVKESVSVMGVMRKLGINYFSGGMHSHITSRIKHFEIDMSHFTGQGHNKGKVANNKKHYTEILVIRSADRPKEKAHQLRRALIESGVKYCCNKCGIGDSWQNEKLVLEVNHKNSDWHDNRKENLEFLCPNCHSQYRKI